MPPLSTKLQAFCSSALKILFANLIEPCMEFLCDGIDEGVQVAKPAMGIPMTSLNLISQFGIIFDAILPRAESPHEDEIIQCCLIQVI